MLAVGINSYQASCSGVVWNTVLMAPTISLVDFMMKYSDKILIRCQFLQCFIMSYPGNRSSTTIRL
jgi:hypothetical protein